MKQVGRIEVALDAVDWEYVSPSILAAEDSPRDVEYHLGSLFGVSELQYVSCKVFGADFSIETELDGISLIIQNSDVDDPNSICAVVLASEENEGDAAALFERLVLRFRGKKRIGIGS